ncbi:MAG: conjugal transfer protein [Oscillospiraceae bacterium]|nr:conjugal transfer protein [Oscillospiraceae bacterium]
MKREKRPKVKSTGLRRKPVMVMWALLLISMTFAVYKHFTAVDAHTVIEREIVEVQVQDTSQIESFVRWFARIYYTWPVGTEQSAARSDALRGFLTDDLHMLNATFSRDIGSSSTVRDVQVWRIDSLDDHNFRVLFSVERWLQATTVDYVQEVVQERIYNAYGEPTLIDQVVQREVTTSIEDVVLSYYMVIVHVDDAGNAVITHNPTIHGGFERSDFTLPTRVNDTSIDGDMQRDITQFLTEFFTLYPMASESMLAHFVRDNALEVIGVEYEFLELVNPVFIRRGDQMEVYVTVRYYDPRTRAQQLSQFELAVQVVEGNWMIVEVLR